MSTGPARYWIYRLFLVPALTVLMVLLPAVLVSANGSPRAQTQQPARMIVVHAKKYGFSPSVITLKKGETIQLVLISDDVRHGLAVRGLGIRSEILPGRRNEVLVTPAEVGDFHGACWVYCGSGHRDMEFMVHVVD